MLGLGGNEGHMLPEHLSSLEGVKIVKIACGWDHCLALNSAGKVLSWGSGQNGERVYGIACISCSVSTKERYGWLTVLETRCF